MEVTLGVDDPPVTVAATGGDWVVFMAREKERMEVMEVVALVVPVPAPSKDGVGEGEEVRVTTREPLEKGDTEVEGEPPPAAAAEAVPNPLLVGFVENEGEEEDEMVAPPLPAGGRESEA